MHMINKVKNCANHIINYALNPRVKSSFIEEKFKDILPKGTVFIFDYQYVDPRVEFHTSHSRKA